MVANHLYLNVIYQQGETSMQKTILNDVLAMLKQHKLVKNESEFCEDWLGRSQSYMRCLRFHNELPSIASVAVCTSKLQHYGQRLAETGEHDELSDRFIALSEACHQHINAESEASWLGDAQRGHAAQKTERAV